MAAAVLAELGGADGITVHLREDRRHIQDRDVRVLRETVKVPLNLEMAATDEMVGIAIEVGPDLVTLVPEKREEVTTEGRPRRGGATAAGSPTRSTVSRRWASRSTSSSTRTPPQIEACGALGARGLEIHTGAYAGAPDREAREAELERIRRAAASAARAGLEVHAGHGLDYDNVTAVARVPEVRELAIGHAVVGRAVLVGMERAVREMRERIRDSAGGP